MFVGCFLVALVGGKGWQRKGVVLRSSGKKECDNRHFASGSCSVCAFEAPKEKERELDSLSYQENMISLENKKLEWLIKQGKENDEDLNFFRSLVP